MTRRAWANSFLARTERHESGCWLWTGPVSDQGYGTAYDGYEKKVSGVHRIAYRMCYGPIPEGLEIDHLCFVRNCINPAHLEAVTPEVNQRRRKDQADALAGRFSTSKACARLGVSASTLVRLAKDGSVPFTLGPNGRRQFRREDLDALITRSGAA